MYRSLCKAMSHSGECTCQIKQPTCDRKMAAPAQVVCVIKAVCLKHLSDAVRKFKVLSPGETFKQIEQEYACNEATRCSISLSSLESGPWTSLANSVNTDDMYTSPVADVWLIGCLTPYKQPWSIHGDEVMTMK